MVHTHDSLRVKCVAPPCDECGRIRQQKCDRSCHFHDLYHLSQRPAYAKVKHKYLCAHGRKCIFWFLGDIEAGSGGSAPLRQLLLWLISLRARWRVSFCFSSFSTFAVVSGFLSQTLTVWPYHPASMHSISLLFPLSLTPFAFYSWLESILPHSPIAIIFHSSLLQHKIW